jgi:alanine racemase
VELASAQGTQNELLLISSSSEIYGSVLNDTIVQRNCFLHVRGNIFGNLTVERGAKVVVEGSVDGKITNRGGGLVVNNKGHAAYVMRDGPPEAEAWGILKINLTAIALNWDTLSRRTEGECAAGVTGNAYGCGIDPIAGALAKAGCKTFFVSNLSEARRVRAVAPKSTIYVLNGICTGTAPAFAQVNARPVINNVIELAEWDAFVGSRQWTGGCALNVNTGERGLGLSMAEAAAFAPRVHSQNHGISLLMSRLEHDEKPDHPMNERQTAMFRDLHRLYYGVPASLATSSSIFIGPRVHFDLVRAGAALYGINPTPDVANPMLPVLELRARIVQLCNLAKGKMIANGGSWVAKRPTRLAFVSVGYADGYPRPASSSENNLQVIIGGQRCPVAGPPSMDLLPIDITDLADPMAAHVGAIVTLIGADLSISDLAAAAKSTGREVLVRLGHRFHRIYYA